MRKVIQHTTDRVGGGLAEAADRGVLHDLGEALELVGPCRIPGRLHDLGAYPALKRRPGIAEGRLYRIRDPRVLRLLDGFEGERIGLTIFNSSPVQIFPLTDDVTVPDCDLVGVRHCRFIVLMLGTGLAAFVCFSRSFSPTPISLWPTTVLVLPY